MQFQTKCCSTSISSFAQSIEYIQNFTLFAKSNEPLNFKWPQLWFEWLLLKKYSNFLSRDNERWRIKCSNSFFKFSCHKWHFKSCEMEAKKKTKIYLKWVICYLRWNYEVRLNFVVCQIWFARSTATWFYFEFIAEIIKCRFRYMNTSASKRSKSILKLKRITEHLVLLCFHSL